VANEPRIPVKEVIECKTLPQWVAGTRAVDGGGLSQEKEAVPCLSQAYSVQFAKRRTPLHCLPVPNRVPVPRWRQYLEGQ
jgi:hypothetical protein